MKLSSEVRKVIEGALSRTWKKTKDPLYEVKPSLKKTTVTSRSAPGKTAVKQVDKVVRQGVRKVLVNRAESATGLKRPKGKVTKALFPNLKTEQSWRKK